MTIFLLITVAFALLSVAALGAGVSALRRRRPLRLASHLSFALLSFALAVLFGALAISTRGYQVLTHEDMVATITTRPLGEQRFAAHFQFPDGREKEVELSGDELYVDAHILKWKPIGNFLGLKTIYELNRVTGRYTQIDDEQSRPRTIHSLADNKPLDLFELRRRYPLLEPFVDAEYGSGTFLPAKGTDRFELRVSTSGLLLRFAGNP